MQSVGADHDVEPAWRRVFESHLAVGGDCRDRVAEQVLDLIAAGVVVGLAEIVSHDLDVAVGYGAGDLGEINTSGPLGPLAVQRQHVGPGGERLDLRQHTHLFRDFHGRPEQINGVTTRLSQCGRAFDDGDFESVPGQPVGQYGAGDAGTRDQNTHGALLTKLGYPNIVPTCR